MTYCRKATSKMLDMVKRILVLMLVAVIVLVNAPIETKAGAMEELFGFSIYNFHYVDEGGNKKEASCYQWGSEGEGGITISRGLGYMNIKIDAGTNELYDEYEPVLMWVHRGDALFDPIYLGEPPAEWYEKKLQQTFMIYRLPGGGEDVDVTVNIPMFQNVGINGLINGGYFEIDFYTEDAIPEILKFAYDVQTYTLEELENYIEQDMNEQIKDYYNIDTGFEVDKDALPFQNTGESGNEGTCAGYSSLVSGVFNQVSIPTEYDNDGKFVITPEEYGWYENVYGKEPLFDIELKDELFMKHNCPSHSMISDSLANAYQRACFYMAIPDVEAFKNLLDYLHVKNNFKCLIGGNTSKGGWLNNCWTIIDHMASWLRQGKAIIVNLSSNDGGGHTIVGYKMEQIDENIYRLHCYDPNRPNNMDLCHIEGYEDNDDLASTGEYLYKKWQKCSTYIDFTKYTKIGVFNGKKYEVDYFAFDSSGTSYGVTSSNGRICFTLYKGGSDFDVINYDTCTNEIMCFRAFPVQVDPYTVKIRTFAFYKSGKVVEVTNSDYTYVSMDYSFIGKYKIKDSSVTLIDGSKFDENGSTYIDCYVTHFGLYNQEGKIMVRMPVNK